MIRIVKNPHASSINFNNNIESAADSLTGVAQRIVFGDLPLQASAAGMRRRHAPQACAAGMRRRHVPQASAAGNQAPQDEG
jgi:hypothetical protein